MSEQQTIHTTLGDLIVAVTDEIGPFMGNRRSTYIVASLILDDLIARRRLRLKKRATRVRR